MTATMTAATNVTRFAVVIAALVLSWPIAADEAMPDSAGGRYTFNKTADGVVRLDTQTGAVSLCSPRTVGWACVAAPEDRAALESEIDRLRGENAALKKELLARGLPLPAGIMPEPGPSESGNDITIKLPDNADINRALAYVDQMWQQLVAALSRAEKQVLNKG